MNIENSRDLTIPKAPDKIGLIGHVLNRRIGHVVQDTVDSFAPAGVNNRTEQFQPLRVNGGSSQQQEARQKE